MKKIIFVSIFILGMIIPGLNVKATDVSNEEELRAAIQQGGDITLTEDIEVTEPLVIDKDVYIDGYGNDILMQGDNTLLTVNSGNVSLGIVLYAGWNGSYDNFNLVKGQGKAIEVNGGTVNLGNSGLYAGNVGLEVNGGTVTISEYSITSIYAGEHNENNNTYSGDQGMIVNGGNVTFDYSDYSLYIYSGGTALTVNKGSNVTLNKKFRIYSYEGNWIEVNNGSVVNINSTSQSSICGTKNSIYLNGGTDNLSYKVGLGSSTSGYGIYINKGINTTTKGDVLNLESNFVFGYERGTTPNFSVYVNPDIDELKITDEKEFFELLDNKLNLGFCGGIWMYGSQSEEERKAICTNLNSNYDGEVESNELNKCAVVYINGEKQNDADASCNPVADNDNKNEPSEVVNVHATSA